MLGVRIHCGAPILGDVKHASEARTCGTHPQQPGGWPRWLTSLTALPFVAPSGAAVRPLGRSAVRGRAGSTFGVSTRPGCALGSPAATPTLRSASTTASRTSAPSRAAGATPRPRGERRAAATRRILRVAGPPPTLRQVGGWPSWLTERGPAATPAIGACAAAAVAATVGSGRAVPHDAVLVRFLLRRVGGPLPSDGPVARLRQGRSRPMTWMRLALEEIAVLAVIVAFFALTVAVVWVLVPS